MAGRSTTRLIWKPLLVLAVLLAGGLAWGLAGALAGTSAPSPSPTTGEVDLHLGWTQEPDNLNPYVGYQAECWEIWALNYDYLFGSGDHNQPALDLASEFPTQQNGGISANGKIWTIHIRQGVKWQDGVPLTAADVAFSYNYVIKNDLTQYTLDTGGILKATALNAATVQLTCAHPMATGFVETQSLPIVPQHIWQHVSADAAQSSYTPPVPLVGMVPSRWSPGRRAATSRWTATRTTGVPNPPSRRSSSRPTRTPRRWSPTSRPAGSTAPGAFLSRSSASSSR